MATDIEWTLNRLKQLLNNDESSETKLNYIASFVAELRSELNLD